MQRFIKQLAEMKVKIKMKVKVRMKKIIHLHVYIIKRLQTLKILMQWIKDT